MCSVHQLLLLAALVATTSTALAQERGPRGFGGGFGGGPSGAMLLGQKAIQDDLKLSEEQVKQVEEFVAKQREGFADLRDASREERMKRFTESREAGEKAVDTILNEEQRVRLKQISLQLAGPGAFANPEVAEKLAFTDEQKKSIEEIQSAQREEMRSLMQDADGDRAAAFRKVQAARQATDEKLKGLLTDEQKSKWEELVGKKFEGQLQGPGGGRGFGRGRRGGDDASLRREADTTVLTADKSDEVKAEKKDAKEKDADKKADGDRKTAKRPRDSKQKHARHGKHRDRGEHTARHHARGSRARHADHGHARHGRGPEYGLAYRGYHRHPHARFAHHGYRPQFGGPLHGGQFAHRGHHPRHHFGPGRPFGRDVNARRQAWNRVALAMGARHGHRSFSHAGLRHRGPQHFAHRGPGELQRQQFGPPHFAARSWRGPGHHGRSPHFRAWPHYGWHHDQVASHHRGPRPGDDERRMSGFGGPRPPHFAWHIERHREDGPGVDRERGEHRPPRMHPAGFKKRHRGEGDERPRKDGDHEKRHPKRPGSKSDKQKEASDRDEDKSREKDRARDNEKDSDKSDKQDD